MENIKNMLASRCMMLLLLVLGCGGRRVEAAEASKFYQLETVVPEYGAVGQKQIVRVSLTPTKDWKINKKFPTKLMVETRPDVLVLQPIQKSGDAVVLRDGRMEFHVTTTPTKAGAYELMLTLKFGLCRKSECIWRTELIAVNLKAH